MEGTLRDEEEGRSYVFAALMLGAGFVIGIWTVLLVNKLRSLQPKKAEQPEEELLTLTETDDTPLALIELGPRVFFHIETEDTIKTLILVAQAMSWEG
jgi:hypothetical protein